MTVRNRSFAALLGAMVLCAAMVLGPAARGHAQESAHQVPADFKGIVGLGLIGAELGMVIPAIAGVDATWAYLVFPAVGAIGGGVAGYFLLENNDQTDLSIAMLGVGMALVIPSAVLTLSLTAYDPEDEAPVVEAARFDVRDAREARARMRSGGGLVRIADGGAWLGAPTIGPIASVDANGRAAVRFGASDFQLALLSGSF